MPQSIITLAKDADLESLPNGAPQIYWTEPFTWGMCAGAAGVRVQGTILQLTVAPDTGLADTYIGLIGQWSNDQRSWTDFLTSVDGQVGPQLLQPGSAGSVFNGQYAGAPYEMAPFVRFGAVVARNGGRQGRIRCSIDFVVLDTLDASVSQFTDVADEEGEITAVNDILGGVLVTWAYDRGMIHIRSGTLTNVTSLTLTVETSFVHTYDPTNTGVFWEPLGTLVFTASEQAQSLVISGLDVLTRVRCTALTTGGSPSATFDAFATLRPAP